MEEELEKVSAKAQSDCSGWLKTSDNILLTVAGMGRAVDLLVIACGVFASGV